MFFSSAMAAEEQSCDTAKDVKVSSTIKETTLSIIKPNAVKGHVVGDVISYLEHAGLNVVASKMIHMTTEQAQEFYKEHRERPFYNDLVTFMTSGPVVVQVLEGDSAVQRNRDVMGATNPEAAAPGTIRASFGDNIEENAVHGSDSLESAEREIAFFFDAEDIFTHTN